MANSATSSSGFSLDSLLEKAGVKSGTPSNEAWAEQIEKTQKSVSVSADTKYDAPKDVAGIAQTIDHTLLKLDATEAQIDTLCEEAKRDGFKVRKIF